VHPPYTDIRSPIHTYTARLNDRLRACMGISPPRNFLHARLLGMQLHSWIDRFCVSFYFFFFSFFSFFFLSLTTRSDAMSSTYLPGVCYITCVSNRGRIIIKCVLEDASSFGTLMGSSSVI
jgi:hypothetical protein